VTKNMLTEDGSYVLEFMLPAEPSMSNEWCSRLEFRCVDLRWLHRWAQIGFVSFEYKTGDTTWAGRALVGPDGCEFFGVSAVARADRHYPHFREKAAQACVDYLLLKSSESPNAVGQPAMS